MIEPVPQVASFATTMSTLFLVTHGPETHNDRNATMPSGVLTKAEIKALGLIRAPDGGSLDEKCYQPASFDFRLGGECIYPKKDRDNRRKPDDCTTNGVVIAPFASVVVSTYETVRLPYNVVGRFNLRIALALEGLIVQMGTQIEPGYTGHLFAMLQSISDREICLTYCDYDTRPFTIEFAYTSKEARDVSKPNKSLSEIMPRNAVQGTINTIVTNIRSAQAKLESLSLGRQSAISRLV